MLDKDQEIVNKINEGGVDAAQEIKKGIGEGSKLLSLQKQRDQKAGDEAEGKSFGTKGGTAEKDLQETVSILGQIATVGLPVTKLPLQTVAQGSKV